MELVYNQEYQLQLLERKISRAQGERSNEEKAALAAKIHVLTKELEASSQTATLLGTQLKKVEEDVKAARRRSEAVRRERERLEGRMHELGLDNDSAARSLRAVVKTKEELLITENFVRLDVKRLRGIHIYVIFSFLFSSLFIFSVSLSLLFYLLIFFLNEPDILYRRADEVFNLGNRKLQLRLAMEERQHEIAIHRDALRFPLLFALSSPLLFFSHPLHE